MGANQVSRLVLQCERCVLSCQVLIEIVYSTGVVPETQCKAKRESKQQQQQQQQKDKQAAGSTTTSPLKNGTVAVVVPQQKDPASPKSFSPNSSNSPASTITTLFEMASLSQEQQDLINKLVVFQDQFELPSEDDFKNITVRIRLGIFWYDCKLTFRVLLL